MSDRHDQLERIVERLRQERDELRLRAHLLHADLQDEWANVERKWHQLEPKLQQLREGAHESAGDIGAATAQLGEEIAHAYKRIRQALK